MDIRLGGPLAATAAVTALTSPFIRERLHESQKLDHPNERSSHQVPTPRGGGLACALGLVVGGVVGRCIGASPSLVWSGSSALLGMVGWVDDLSSLDLAPRLGAQVFVGLVAGGRLGGPMGSSVGAVLVPCVVNAVNFMDGINGITGMTAAVWGLSMLSDHRLPDSVRLEGALTAGMGVGFLPFNVPDASMFLGDVGSYLIGTGISVSVLEAFFHPGNKPGPVRLAALLPMLPYLADTGATLILRGIRGEVIGEAHRDHFYQRLVRDGDLPHWVVSAGVASASLGCVLMGRARGSVLGAVPVLACYLASPKVVARFRGMRRLLKST